MQTNGMLKSVNFQLVLDILQLKCDLLKGECELHE